MLEDDLRYHIDNMQSWSYVADTLTSVLCIIITEKDCEVVDIEEVNDYEIYFKRGVEI